MPNFNQNNKVSLIGRTGSDPEYRMLEGGKSMCKVSLATSDRWKDKQGEWQERTAWHKLVAWGPLAERMNSTMVKGAQYVVDGKLTYNSWKKEDGTTQVTAQIEVQAITAFNKKGSYDGSNDATPTADLPPKSPPITPDPTYDEELPF